MNGAPPSAADAPALARVDRELGRYRTVAAAIPLLAVVLLATKGLSNPTAVAILGVTGLAGVLLAFALEGKTRAVLAALRVEGE